MKNRGSIICGLMSVSWLFMTSTAAVYTLDLKYGEFPSDVKTEDVDGLLLDESCYQRGITDKGWSVERYGSIGYVALSPTYTKEAGTQNNRLTLPPVNIDSDNAVVRWGACSVHPDFPDSYNVTVTDADGKEKTIFSSTGESPEWTVRTADLSAYAGKEITVNFVATSSEGYMLAVGEVSVGEPDDLRFQVSDNTLRYTGIAEGDVKVTGTITNAGKPLDFIKLVCKVDDRIVDEQNVSTVFSTGKSIDFNFDVAPELNKSTHYYIYGVDDAGNETALHDDSFFTSYFRRTLLVDKGTGMWCNNCPNGILELESLQSRYGKSLISVETHVDDDLEQQEYWDALKFYAAPYFRLNRNATTSYSNSSKFTKEYEAATPWWIQFTGLTVNDGTLNVKISAQSALGVNNSDDRYRIGYLLTRDYDSQPEGMTFYQSNNVTRSTGKRFYFLPGFVPGKLMRFHDVTLPSEHAFTGLASSLPESVEPYEEYEVSWNVPFSDYADCMDEINVVVYVFDRETNRIQNAATMTLDRWKDVASIDIPVENNGVDVNMSPDGNCRIYFGNGYEGDYRLEIFNAGGFSLYAGQDYVDGNTVEKSLSLPSGMVIARVSSSCGCVVKKFIIK